MPTKLYTYLLLKYKSRIIKIKNIYFSKRLLKYLKFYKTPFLLIRRDSFKKRTESETTLLGLYKKIMFCFFFLKFHSIVILIKNNQNNSIVLI